MQNILVIEDNEQNRELMRQILESNGYQVLESTDGAGGLKMIEENAIDLVLLDIQMPVMDGFGVIRELRSNHAYDNLKVIAITSFAMKGDREKALTAGFNEYVTKPIDTRKLPELIRKVLEVC